MNHIPWKLYIPRSHYYLPFRDKLNTVLILKEKPTNYLKPLCRCFEFSIRDTIQIIFYIFEINIFTYIFIITISIEKIIKYIAKCPNEYVYKQTIVKKAILVSTLCT